MKNKKIIIAIVTILIICLSLIIYFVYNKDDKKQEEIKNNKDIVTKKDAENHIKKITEVVMNGGSKEELVKVLKTNQFNDSYIMTGEDMYLLQSPDYNIILKYSLEEYVKESKKLKNNLEKHIKKDFEYKINDITEVKDYMSVNITYKTYYYTSYINDLAQIQVYLLEKEGYSLENVIENEQFIVAAYKAKIKAASILNDYLDIYSNKSEFNTTIVSFVNKKISDSNEEFLSYLINLTGYTYDYVGILSNNKNIEAFLANYDLKKPLDL